MELAFPNDTPPDDNSNASPEEPPADPEPGNPDKKDQPEGEPSDTAAPAEMEASDEPEPPTRNTPDPPSSSPDITARVLTLSNPITVGDENVFFVYLRNNGQTPATNIVIQAVVSENLTVMSLAQKNAEASQFQNAVDADNGNISVPAIASLDSGQSLLPYQVKVKAGSEGTGTLSLTIKADGLDKAIEVRQEVKIISAK